jgi:glycosyltransferase involved in cell wall biosynthesis
MRRRVDPLVCFAGCDWWYHNRGLFCPQIMRRLAKNYRILFVNSLGMRVPSLRKDKHALRKIFRKVRSICRCVRQTDDGMSVLSPVSVPWFGSALSRKLNASFVALQIRMAMWALRIKQPVFYVNCLPALEVIRGWPRRLLIYERTDLFEEMPGADKQYIAALDRELIKSADLVLYVNRQLFEQGLDLNRNSLLIGHGVDVELFVHASQNGDPPADMKGIPGPIVGYFGDVSEKTSDLNLLEYVAQSLRHVSLVFIGSISTDVSGLSSHPNVYFLGQKPYLEIPSYGAQFDVAIMPWNQNRWIEFCNPIKLKEYLALGKPVVTTYYPEIEPYKDLVYVARNYEEFVAAIRTALDEDDPAKVDQRHDMVRNETWDSKVTVIRNFIEEHMPRA